MKSDFQVVSAWNKKAGVAFPDSPTLENSSAVSLSVSLIEEELRELKEAIEAKDIIAVADALADLSVVVNGAGYRLGFNMDNLMKSVMDSNFSKFDYTLEDAQKSVENYTNKFGRGYAYLALASEPPNTTYVIRRTSDDKILKSHQFKEPAIDLNNTVTTSKLKVIVMKGCVPCKKVQEIINKVEHISQVVDIIDVNSEEGSKYASSYGMGLPALIDSNGLLHTGFYSVMGQIKKKIPSLVF